MTTASSFAKSALATAAAAVVFQTSGLVDAQAAFGPVNYGDFTGISVTYENVTESSGTDDSALFGTPTVLGNTLDFNPMGLTAHSSGGGAPDITDAQLNLGISAHNGFYIDIVEFSELGEFTIAGSGTSDTFASVSGNVFIEITEVDGVSIDPILFNQVMTYVPLASGVFTLPDYGTGTSTAWSGGVSIDVGDILAAELPGAVGATKISVVLDNVLQATSESGSSVFIAKKDFKGFTVTVIPEPSTIALALVGALALGGVAMRRRNSIARR